MKIGNLGYQYVLLSEEAYDRIEFKGFTIPDFETHFNEGGKREIEAKKEYEKIKYDANLFREEYTSSQIIRELKLCETKEEMYSKMKGIVESCRELSEEALNLVEENEYAM